MDPAVAIFHYVKNGADDVLVLAQRISARRRHIGPVERRDDPELAIDRMRRRQQLAGRFAAQHIAPAGTVGQAIGRIGLAAAELLDAKRGYETRDLVGHERRQRPLIEPVLFLHRRRAEIVCSPPCHTAPERLFTLAEFARPLTSTQSPALRDRAYPPASRRRVTAPRRVHRSA